MRNGVRFGLALASVLSLSSLGAIHHVPYDFPTIQEAIVKALPGAHVAVSAGSSGHYEISVVSELFSGKSRVQQQQLVYAAIAHLMAGNHAPLHAVDRLQTKTP